MSLIPDFTLPIHYIRQIAEQLQEMEVDTGQWLKNAGLTEAQLQDDNTQMGFDTLRQLILQGMAITQEPAIGLLIGERLLVNSHGILGYAAMNSASLRQAMDLVERYIGLRTSMVAYRHEIHGDEVRQVFTETLPLGDMQRPVLETITLTIKNVLDFITMKSCPIHYMAFPFPDPGYADLAQDMFACEVRYNQGWTGCTMSKDILDRPLKQADAAMFHAAEAICQQELNKLTQQHSLSARIRRLMLEKQNGFPSLQVTARMFNVTPRTLHRRLLDEGTSFKDLLEDVRHDLALQHLQSGHMSVQEVAYTLGYTDVSNFRRAFKRWTGQAPTEFLTKPIGMAT
jgi:AraC-like DNA-binding protein